MTRKTAKYKARPSTVQSPTDKSDPNETDVKQPKVRAYDQGNGYQLFGYEAHQIPSKMRVPYISTGYRLPGMTADQCVGSLLQPHNELCNVWSHVIALIVFVTQVAPIVRSANVVEDPLVVPLLCCTLAICVMFLASIFTHLFNSMSPYMYHICFFFDYAAISSCFFIVSQAVYFYSRPLNTTFTIFNSPEIFLYLNLFNSLICTFICCSVLLKRPWYHIAVRASAYFSLCLFTVFPLISRLASCKFAPSNSCPASSLIHYKQCAVYFTLGGFIYSMRIPERFASGMFDVVGQSHNVFHVLSALGVWQLFSALNVDMNDRREALVRSPLAFTEMSIMFTVLGLVANVTIVVWMAQSLYSRQNEKKK